MRAATENTQAPMVVGAAQLVQRGVELAESLDPLAMLCQVARGAARDAGAGEALLESLDTICLVDAVGWHPDNAPALLADALGARPKTLVSAPIGGESGLSLINAAATRIAAGESRAAFVGGVHVLKSLRSAIKARVRLTWPKGGRGALQMASDPRPGETELERRHGLESPPEFYPIFENALRARRSRELQEHRAALGRLFSPMTQVAAKNPYAWFPVERSAAELCEVTRSNRMIAYPYPKYLNAVLDTDQAAGVLLMSADAARSAGLRSERGMYWLGGGYAEEKSWFVSERADLSRSAALEACATRVLGAAGVAMDDIDFIDFYSCFPVAVELACEAYAISEGDPRGLTVTGGLPYAGGPGSNYTTHAVATMLERLRARPGSVGLCTGNGWYLTKHAATLFGTEPRALQPISQSAAEPKSVGAAPLRIAGACTGWGRVDGYTVTYDREGAPSRGIVIGTLDSGERFIANTPPDRSLLEAIAARELCGVRGKVETLDGLGSFVPE
jgi:acetyl-CoA C-acetyltransferase